MVAAHEQSKPWCLIFAQIIGDTRFTKIAKMMVLPGRLILLGQVQICAPIHLHRPCTFILKKMLRFHILDISYTDYDPVELKHDEMHRGA